MLPRRARRVFAAIERAIGDRSSASVSYVGFALNHHIARKAVSPSLKLLSGKSGDGITGSSPKRPRVMQRRVPSLPTIPWQDDGR
jgi:hypothetical protein